MPGSLSFGELQAIYYAGAKYHMVCSEGTASGRLWPLDLFGRKPRNWTRTRFPIFSRFSIL